MKVTLRFPGKRSDDVRSAVTLHDLPELPWPLTFFFLLVGDDEKPDSAPEWVNVGFEMGTRWKRDSVDADFNLDRAVISPGRVRWVTENFFRYRRLAEDELVARSPSMARGAIRRSAAAGGLSDEFLAIAIADLRSWGEDRGAVNALAEARGVSRVTVWRWRKEAERRGIRP